MNPIKEIDHRVRWLFGWVPMRLKYGPSDMDLEFAEFVHWHATLRNNMNIQTTMSAAILRMKSKRMGLQP